MLCGLNRGLCWLSARRARSALASSLWCSCMLSGMLGACALMQANKSFFSEIIASISDISFSRDGRYILSRDYMTLKLWDINKESAPVATFNTHEQLRSRVSASADLRVQADSEHRQGQELEAGQRFCSAARRTERCAVHSVHSSLKGKCSCNTCVPSGRMLFCHST